MTQQAMSLVPIPGGPGYETGVGTGDVGKVFPEIMMSD